MRKKRKRGSNTVFLKVSMTNQKMFLCYFLRKKDSKSRTKINSSPRLVRAYVRTRAIPKFLGLMDLLISIAMDAPPAGAFGARGSSATN